MTRRLISSSESVARPWASRGELAERGIGLCHRSDTGVYPPASKCLEGLGFVGPMGVSEDIWIRADISSSETRCHRENTEVECVGDRESLRSLRNHLKIIFCPDTIS